MESPLQQQPIPNHGKFNHIHPILNPEVPVVTPENPLPTISRLWDELAQEAVINSVSGPTIASRAYAMVHTAMYDAWSAYDPLAIGTQLGDNLQRPLSENTNFNKTQAMSFAAYRVLSELFPAQVETFNKLMVKLGLETNNTTTDTTTPAGIGNVSAEALLRFRSNDGSNQLGDDPNGDGTPYSDISSYEPINFPGSSINIERWTPEPVPIDAEPGEEDRIQTFLTPQWGKVIPFSSISVEKIRPQPPKPFLLVDGEVDLDASTITLPDGSVVAISKDIVGTIINPEFIAQAENIANVRANLTDEQKLIAELWEDGHGTSYPPGTWMNFGEFISARDNHTLDEDVKLFFSLGNALFDAGIAAWGSKVFYDYARPVRVVRELGAQGLIGEFNPELGGFAIDSWKDPTEGTATILATNFLTYQAPGEEPSPPFAEYISGHSSFSAAGAEILKRFTGSDDFGGGITFEVGESVFEPGITPKVPVTLEWNTFSEASDQAGISRIYGGIHFEDGDLNGRALGREVAEHVWEKTQGVITPNTIIATNEKDNLIGSVTNDLIYSNRSDDIVFGNEGNDMLCGGKGNDIVNGGAGADLIYGDFGDDILIGGVGGDNFHFRSNDGNNIITDFEDGIDVIGLGDGLSFQQLTISQIGNDTRISANQLSITLQGVEESAINIEDFRDCKI